MRNIAEKGLEKIKQVIRFEILNFNFEQSKKSLLNLLSKFNIKDVHVSLTTNEVEIELDEVNEVKVLEIIDELVKEQNIKHLYYETI